MSLRAQLKTLVIGKSRDLSDQRLFHRLSLIAFLAWVGLGADGLSSSCYGPPEAFEVLTKHPSLSLFVALASAATVLIISASYSQIIDLFPTGGGGYLVASKLLSPALGVVSGCALLVDYMLTITISIASGADALFSLAPPAWHGAKFGFEVLGVIFLTVLNLRGAKEAVLPWVPIFLVFVLTHALAIGYAVCTHLGSFPALPATVLTDLRQAHSEVGWMGVLLLLLRAYSLGAGTYTGIEAVSNGLPLLREPRVETGKRTMRFMAVSLAVTVAGLLVAYLLYRVEPVEGKTLNAVLFEHLTSAWPRGSAYGFLLITLASEAALLFVAAQAGFLDGPRVLANMALDRWFPGRFAMFSDRFVTHNGLLMMGGAAALLMILSRGSVDLLVVLYSINVFITFSLSQLGMVRHWWEVRRTEGGWRKKLLVNGVGFLLTASILVSLSLIKFWEGGWATLVATGLLVALAFLVKRHYEQAFRDLRRLDDLVAATELSPRAAAPPAPAVEADLSAKTAVVMVNGFNGLGLHTLFGILRLFPGVFKNFVFVQVGIVDAGNFKGKAEVENLQQQVDRDLSRYVDYLRQRRLYAEGASAIGIDVVSEVAHLAPKLLTRFPQAIFFGGQLVFRHETFFTRLLHNYAVFALQRRFYQQGLPMLILPIRV